MATKTYGTVNAERKKAMSGLEFVKGLVGGELPLNTMAQTLGYDIVEAESGRVVITLVPTEAHLNPAGTVHGGISATLLDSCMGLAVQTSWKKGSARRLWSSKFLSFGPSRRRLARLGPRVRFSTLAVVSAQPKGASRTARHDYSHTAQRRA